MKKQTIDRFGFIESNLLWENGITARKLMEAFDISRQAAQKVINDYRNAFPDQMAYNPKTRQHEVTDDFRPVFIRPDPLKFLDYLRGETMISYYREEREWSEFEVTDVNRLLRPRLSLETLRTVFSALKNKQTVQIDYRKKDLESDECTERIISPNHLVFADNRYHIRGYCHLKHHFLDFVLSRIVCAETSYKDWVPSNEDREWQENVTLAFKPNPELPEGVQKAILRNYDTVESGVWIITCRKALAFYAERSLVAVNEKYGKPLWVRVKNI